MHTEQVGICDGMQVTLEFNHVTEGILERSMFNNRVRAFLEPQVNKGILQGKGLLESVVFVRYHPNTPEELGRDIVNLVIEWRAHYPWWADRPDWFNAPNIKQPTPLEVIHIT